MFVCVCVCVFTRYHSSNLAIAASRSLSSLQNANRAKFAARCCAWQRSQPSNTGLAHRKHAGRAMQCSAAHLVLRAVERRGWYRHDAFLVDGIPAKCPVPRHGRAGRCGHGEILGRDVHLQLAPAQPCTHTATQSQTQASTLLVSANTKNVPWGTTGCKPAVRSPAKSLSRLDW